MKILIFIISIYGIFLNTTNATEKKNCKEFKKFTKDHISCVAKNIKNITLKGTDKIKKDVNSAADEVKDDASNVKDKTEKLIKKGKEKLN